MQNNRELEYYATPGPMTELSRCARDAFDGLPEAPDELMKVVRRLVVAALPAPEDRTDPQIRPAASMVERIQQLDPSPLVEPRPPHKRFVGNCRHFATLTCALLRRQRMPARVRAGFAGYFEPNTWADHWIIEYWRPSEERWVRVDPQWGDAWAKTRDPDATSESLAGSMYWSGGEAWQRCRRGELDPDRCNMGGVNWGIGEVRGSVLFDLAALNQHEMLPWDTWGRMEAAYRGETDAAYDEMLDAVSAVISGGDFDAIGELYDRNGDLQVPPSLLPATVS
ncbi:MAG: transglutaminase-like domain-containing protein [Dehalococcoidia bacterium]